MKSPKNLPEHISDISKKICNSGEEMSRSVTRIILVVKPILKILAKINF